MVEIIFELMVLWSLLFVRLLVVVIADEPSEQTSELSDAWSDSKGFQDLQRLHHPAAAAERALKQ